MDPGIVVSKATNFVVYNLVKEAMSSSENKMSIAASEESLFTKQAACRLLLANLQALK